LIGRGTDDAGGGALLSGGDDAFFGDPETGESGVWLPTGESERSAGLSTLLRGVMGTPIRLEPTSEGCEPCCTGFLGVIHGALAPELPGETGDEVPGGDALVGDEGGDWRCMPMADDCVADE
jgi:hypothetical protein